MKVETYQCDVCGVTKQQSNHWWDMRVRNRKALVQPFDGTMTLGDGEKHYHLCDQKCVVEKLSEVMKGV